MHKLTILEDAVLVNEGDIYPIHKDNTLARTY
jgi:hypothetical protein